MSDDTRLDELLLAWQDARCLGEDPSPEQLCRDAPELAGPLAERIAVLRRSGRLTALDVGGPTGPEREWSPAPEAQRELDEGVTSGSAPTRYDPTAPPDQVGRYQIQHLLGKGGFGEVWRAFDPDLQRAVAVKILRPDRQWPADQVATFLGEGRKLARLKHPGIVAVYDVGQADGGLYIVSELLEGGTLDQRIARGQVARQDIPVLLAEVADAAHHAHLHGLVHRDIKPANILLDAQYRPRLADFGVALAEEEQGGARGIVAGTMAYMSPEQVRGESHLLDGRTDIYSLGVVMYQLLTGRRPFQCQTREEYREQILLRQPRPPRSIDDSIPRPLEDICLKCLSKAVADRYTTAADLAAELRRVAAGTPESTATFQATAPTRRWAWVAAGAAALLLVGCVALVLSGPWTGRGAPLPDDRKPATPPAGDGPDSIQVKNLLPAKPSGSGTIWKVIDEENSLRVTTGVVSLLQLATVPEDFELAIEFSQVHATGNIGVFFGYREDREKGQGRYQVIQMMTGAGGPSLKRMTRFFTLSSPLGSHSGENIGLDAPVKSQGKNTLVLRVRGNRLTEVLFNGVKKPELTADVPDRFDQCRGPLGAYNRNSDGLFARVIIDNGLKKFAPGQGG